MEIISEFQTEADKPAIETKAKKSAPKQIEAKAESVKEAAKEYTFIEVRTILAEKSRAGHTADIKKILVSHGAENLTYYDQEMHDCVESYCGFVMEQIEEAKNHCPDPQVLIEKRLDFSRWVKNDFGTGDCVIVADDVLQIIDYKHGLGVLVSAEKNPQMMCYALGALELFDGIYDINSIQMIIFQPRRENVSTYNISKEELLSWADEVVWEEFWFDQEINDRGIQLDLRMVENAISLDEISKEKLSIVIRKITNLDNSNSVAQMKGWLLNQGG